MNPASIDELRQVIALDGLPDEHLQWILDRSELREYDDGVVVAKTGDPAEGMIIILAGKLAFYLDVNGTLVYYLTFENDKSTGGITGLIPHSRMKVSPGNSIAVGNLRALQLPKEYFVALEQLNPEFTQRLIGYLTERAKTFATIQLQHEKVSALGKLSAGIAHELNNPAAAISRIASELRRRLDANYALTSKLFSDRVDATHIERVRALSELKASQPQQSLTALQRMEKEDALVDWLEANGLAKEKQAAEALSECGISADDLDELYRGASSDAFGDLIRWLENILISARLIKDLGDASGRISHLVGAIKSHVHMDRTNDVQRTDIHGDIENTLTLLGHKIREKNIAITKRFSEGLPQVEAYVGELNQVWTNLIDNAIDALDKNGELAIETSCDKNTATIRFIDNGCGIPADIVSRIFDPFFTTKKVGQGTGIGLDIVKRIIDRHRGQIKVYSVPGRTEFVVSIPISQRQDAA